MTERSRPIRRNLVVVGASAGGIEALEVLVRDLPGDFRATVLIVLHIPATGTSALPALLARRTRLPVRHAVDGDALDPGLILVAPPDHHLIVYDGRVALSGGPKEDGHRPSIDVLFRSAARMSGARVIGVILSGALTDGAAGMVSVIGEGGVGVVQDPDDARHPSMPVHAIDAAAIEHVVPVREIGAILQQLVAEEVWLPPDESAALATLDVTSSDPSRLRPYHPSVHDEYKVRCPECHGPLREEILAGHVHVSCRAGHQWDLRGLAARHAVAMESALWASVRSCEQRTALCRDLERRALVRGNEHSAAYFRHRAEEAEAYADRLRDLLAVVTNRPEVATPDSARAT